jgi:nitrite reductase (NADH) small subunit/3-phenylpropionate/trans-cinnamate dioxygenase ferredoxin subunit
MPMTEYVVGKVDEIAPGTAVAVQAGRRTIAVFRVGDEFFAVNNACPHKGASLCDGELVVADKVVRCPWHHWNWQLGDGKLESDPRQGLRTYEVSVDGDEVILRA